MFPIEVLQLENDRLYAQEVGFSYISQSFCDNCGECDCLDDCEGCDCCDVDEE
jgi:hypothetical protein